MLGISTAKTWEMYIRSAKPYLMCIARTNEAKNLLLRCRMLTRHSSKTALFSTLHFLLENKLQKAPIGIFVLRKCMSWHCSISK